MAGSGVNTTKLIRHMAKGFRVRPILHFVRTSIAKKAYPIMQAVKLNNGQDEDSLLRKHEGLIRAVARPYAHHGVRTDDLMQEGRMALLAASRTWDASFSGHEGRNAQLWTYAIRFVRAAMFRYATRERNEPANAANWHGEESSEPNTVDSARSPEDSTELTEVLGILSQSVYALSQVERRAIRLRFIDDLDFRAIGDSMGIPKSTAHDLVDGALQKLRDSVEAAL